MVAESLRLGFSEGLDGLTASESPEMPVKIQMPQTPPEAS